MRPPYRALCSPNYALCTESRNDFYFQSAHGERITELRMIFIMRDVRRTKHSIWRSGFMNFFEFVVHEKYMFFGTLGGIKVVPYVKITFRKFYELKLGPVILQEPLRNVTSYQIPSQTLFP